MSEKTNREYKKIGGLEDKTIYKPSEVLEASKAYFNGDEMSATSWINKYALKEPPPKRKDDKDISKLVLYEKDPNQMHQRLASEFSRIEREKGYANPMQEQEFFDLMKDFKYIVPQGSPMSGIGNDLQIVSLSNCFVIGNDEDSSDSYGAIMKIDQEQVQLMKRRGGVGHDLSYIRPKGLPVKNSALTSTGVVPFMERYSNSTKEVAQDGRRGALMLSIGVKHPDVQKFIDAKMEEGKVTNANISVRIDDEFMYALNNNKKYTLQFPINSDNPTVKREVDPNEIWNQIVHNAWTSAEPGILFWDTITRESVADSYADQGFKTVSTNPCGEIPLNPYDSCRLLAINLFGYVDKPFTPEAKFDFDKFKQHVHYAQRISDNIIDLELEKVDKILHKIDSDPEEEEVKYTEKRLWEKIKDSAVKGRRMGLGITGEGDMLAAMGLRYGTKEATDFAVEIQKTLAVEAYRGSVELAKERGAFEIYDWEKEKDNPFIQRIANEDPELYEEMKEHGRRNIALLTIAPTGTVSQMTQTTSGIEPAFLVSYKRNRKINENNLEAEVSFTDKEGNKWEEFNVFHHHFKTWMQANGYNPDEVEKYSRGELNELIKKSPYYKATSNDVDWVEKVRMQGAMQKWIDHSISVTINLPKDVDESLVDKLYRTAWEEGCKGVTIYRDGSREGILKPDEGKLEEILLVQKMVKPHPILEIKPQAVKYKVKREDNKDRLHMIPTSDLYVDDKNKKAYFLPDENFQNRLPPGTATSASFTTEGILLSSTFRGPDPDYVELIEILQSVSSDESEGMGPRKIKSKEHAMGVVLEHYLLMNGVIERDQHTGKLSQVVRKKDLRRIDPKKDQDEYYGIMSQVRVTGDEEISVSGNNGKQDGKFECFLCGNTLSTKKEGCDNPVCIKCGWEDPNKSCN